MDDVENILPHAVIETHTGRFFDTHAPVFDIADIAHGLSNKCRFNGQCNWFYSVAEHSVLVSKLAYILGGDPKEGLLHDAAEAYLPDVPSPYKKLLPDLQAMEHRVEAAMRRHYKLSTAKSDPVKLADTYAVLIEARDLLPSTGAGRNWEALARHRQAAFSFGLLPRFLPPQAAKELFLDQWDEVR